MSKNQDRISESLVEGNLFQSIAAGVIMLAFSFTGYFYITLEKDVASPQKGKAAEKIVAFASNNQSEQIKPEELVSNELFSDINYVSDQVNDDAPIESVIVESEAGQSESAIESNTEVKAIQNNELIMFDADCNLGQVHLFWVTSGDKQDHLVLEQSWDRKKFEMIEDQPEMQTKDGKNIYNLNLIHQELGEVFYRIKSIHPDKSVEYSTIVSTNCKTLDVHIPDIDVFPTGRETFKIIVKTETDDHFTVSLTDLNEIELVEEDFEVTEGSNEYTFQPGTIPHGIYSLKVSNGVITKEKRVTIK